MSDLVKRLRSITRHPSMGGCHMVDDDTIDEAADRIEQLERELAAEVENNKGEFESRTEAERNVRALTGQLAAEKALADRLYPWVYKYAPTGANIGADDDLTAYRKARGL